MTSGSHNTMVGLGAGAGQITGQSNVLVGDLAGFELTSGGNNTIMGSEAGDILRGGSYNIALGHLAGHGIVGGTYNIDIGAQVPADESATIRIGDSNQTRTFIAGIRGVAVTGGQTVQIDANGQLGSVSSSRRFKQDIQDLGDTTETLMALRPVRFRYKSLGPDSPEQYGLIAEEVFELSPALVGRDRDGQIDSVAYDKVNAMVLKLVQEQQRVIERLQARVAELESRSE